MTPIDTPEDLIKAVAAEPTLGTEVAADLERVLRDPRYGRCIGFVSDAQAASVPGELRSAHEVLTRRTPLTGMPGAVHEVVRVALGRLPMRRVLPSEPRARAPSNEPGIARAARGMLTVAEHFHHAVTLPFDPGRFGTLVMLIETGQSVLGAFGRISGRVSRNLGVWETRLTTINRDGFPYMDALAAADEQMVEDLEDTRQYLTGPALQGAETRKEHQRTFENLSAKAAEKGQAAAKSTVWKKITDEFVSFLDARSEPDSDVPQSPNDNRRSDR